MVLEDRTDGQVRRVTVRGPDAAALEELAAAATGAGWEVNVPSLEDVFVAMVRRPARY